MDVSSGVGHVAVGSVEEPPTGPQLCLTEYVMRSPRGLSHFLG